MNTIEQTFFEAALADIAYVDGFVAGMTPAELLEKIQYRVPEPLARLISDRFEVLAVESDPSSDYQGVVFRDKIANNRGQTTVYSQIN